MITCPARIPNAANYMNRKGLYSLNVQTVCDDKLMSRRIYIYIRNFFSRLFYDHLLYDKERRYNADHKEISNIIEMFFGVLTKDFHVSVWFGNYDAI